MMIELDGISVEILRKPIKNMYLRIYPPDGGVKITAPLKLPLDVIRSHLTGKIAWINSARARFVARPSLPALTMQSGEQHYFLGEGYELVVHEGSGPHRIERQDQLIHCFVKPNTSAIEKSRRLQRWYTQQMQAILPALIQKWEPIIGVRVDSFRIRTMKTRWGSCNVVTRRICLNLSLIQKPLACLDYVLVHEMVHLHEANHSKRFYALMDQFLPEWRIYKKQLEMR